MSDDKLKLKFGRDKLLAVIVDEEHPDRGQYLQVPPDDLVAAMKEWAETRESVPAPVQTVLAVPDSIPSEQLEFIQRKLITFEGQLEDARTRIRAVEERPHLSKEDMRNLADGMRTRFKVQIDEQVQEAIKDVKGSLALIESKQETTTLVPSSEAEKISTLAKVVHGFSEYMAEQQQRLDTQGKAVEEHARKIKGLAGVIHQYLSDERGAA